MFKRFIRAFLKITDFESYIRYIGVKVGEGCDIHRTCLFGSEPYLIEIGNNVRLTRGVKIMTHDGGVWVLRNKYKNDSIDLINPVVIGNNVHVGIDAMIMPGVKIGDNVIVGSGAVVTRDVQDNAIVAGVPARVVGNIEQYYEKHRSEFISTKSMTCEEKEKFVKDIPFKS